MSTNIYDRYQLENKTVVITGGGGLLGRMHAQAIAEARGIPVIADVNREAAIEVADSIKRDFGISSIAVKTDITKIEEIVELRDTILEKHPGIDILINNAANNPKAEDESSQLSEQFEDFPMNRWYADIAVGLTGAFLCSQVLGSVMAEKEQGVILNISSDLGIIAPDQRIYRVDGLPDNQQPKKPVSYSVIKHGIIGLTKYLATYWADKNIRVNALCPGGVYTRQDAEFVKSISNLIPLHRMATLDEYKAAIVFLVSDASSYMTGQNLIIDGGRSIW